MSMQNKNRLSSNLVAAKHPIYTSNQLYSSLLGNIKLIFKRLFPKDYFRYTYIRNSVASVTEHQLNDDDKVVKEIPALSLLMNYEPQDSSFSGDPFIHSNMMTYRAAWDNKFYDHILRNFNEKVFISTMSYRQCHAFEVGIHLNTPMQALNTMSYLHSKIGGEKGNRRRLFFNNYWLEIPLPMSLVGALAAAKDFSINNQEDFLEFAKYVEDISNGQIVYKRHSTSGKYLFFFKYKTNLLVTINSISTPEEVKEGKTILSSNIKIDMSVEYDTYNNFILESYQNLKPVDLNSYIVDNEVGVTLHYALQFKYSEELPDGRKCIFRESFLTDSVRGRSGLDSTNFEHALNKVVKAYINKMRTTMDKDLFENLFHTILLYDGYEMTYKEDYEIDWKNFNLIIKNPILNSDYRLFVYADPKPIIEMMQSLKDNTTPSNIYTENAK